MTPKPVYYSTEQVVALTGATYRELQWWDEHDIVTPKREGHRRLYTRVDAQNAVIVSRLRKLHLSLSVARKILEQFRALGETSGYLLHDGKNGSVENDPKCALDVIVRSRKPMYVIKMEDLLRMRSSLRERKVS